MREKLAIAKKLRNSRNSFSNNIVHKKLCSKCYHTYVLECIIKGKNAFKITFKGTYVQSFEQRVVEWYNYVRDSVYRIYLVNVTPNDDKTFQKWSLIHCGVSKPVHFKIASKPNEFILESFLKENGFKITNEHVYSEATVYDVTRI